METLDVRAELGRLRAQVDLAWDVEDGFLGSAGLAPGDHLLDVGCGPGFFAERVARGRLAGGRVTGVDVDPALLALARERLDGEGLPVVFVEGTGARLPLADGAVDFSYARFLFQHLSNPGDVLAEMVRVTRPGGVVAVVDTDDGSLLVHPAPEGFEEFLEASGRAQRDRGGDRLVGRKLASLLVEAGLSETRATARVLGTDRLAPRDFVAITLGFKAAVTGPPWLPEGRAAAIVRELERLAATPGFFGHALAYGAWGRVR